MNRYDGCFCFAIPSKMFRKLIAIPEGTDASTAQRHMKHSFKLRSVRCETPPAEAPGVRARKKVRRSVFDLRSGEVLPGTLVRAEGGKPARDITANQAYENAGIALRFYKEVFARNSVDGRGMQIDAAVHYGQGFQNAMWNGRQMIYGDGDDSIGGFAAALDITAHEISHGVTQHLIPGGLGVQRIPAGEREFKEQKYTLKGQAGALNESFSDVFASMVKQWHAGQTVKEADWLIGRNILAPFLGRAIRSLKSPGNRKLTWYDDDQIRSMDHYEEGMDPHDASGIPNHAFYQAAMKMGGHSWEKAGPIWYEAYDSLGPKAQFADAAQATTEVATKRFGGRSAEVKAVLAGWRKVKVL